MHIFAQAYYTFSTFGTTMVHKVGQKMDCY